VLATKFPMNWPKGCYWESALEKVWGQRGLGLPSEGHGPRSAFEKITPVALASLAARKRLRFEPPLLELSLGTADKYVPVAELARLCTALEAAHIPYFAHWGRYGHGGGRLAGSKNRAFDVQLDEPLLAFARASCNHRPGRDPVGYVNSALEWSAPRNDFDPQSKADDFVDSEELCAFSVRLASGIPAEFTLPPGSDHATADVTPRRLRRFRIAPGGAFDWRAVTPGPDGPEQLIVRASGRVRADTHGMLTLPSVPVFKRGNGTRVEIRAAPASEEPPPAEDAGKPADGRKDDAKGTGQPKDGQDPVEALLESEL
jgi:hypothetical protein